MKGGPIPASPPISLSLLFLGNNTHQFWLSVNRQIHPMHNTGRRARKANQVRASVCNDLSSSKRPPGWGTAIWYISQARSSPLSPLRFSDSPAHQHGSQAKSGLLTPQDLRTTKKDSRTPSATPRRHDGKHHAAHHRSSICRPGKPPPRPPGPIKIERMAGHPLFLLSPIRFCTQHQVIGYAASAAIDNTCGCGDCCCRRCCSSECMARRCRSESPWLDPKPPEDDPEADDPPTAREEEEPLPSPDGEIIRKGGRQEHCPSPPMRQRLCMSIRAPGVHPWAAMTINHGMEWTLDSSR
jgi:hypothetical protein